MGRRGQASNSLVSFIALVILTYFVLLPLVGWILTGYFGSVQNVIVQLAGIIPFGDITEKIAEGLWQTIIKFSQMGFNEEVWNTFKNTFDVVVTVVNQTVNEGALIGDYQFDGTFHTQYVVLETCKTVVTLMLFHPLQKVLCGIMGLTEATGHWNKLKKAVVISSSAVIATCFAPGIIILFENQVAQLSGAVAKWLTSIVSTLAIGGGIAVYALLGGLSAVVFLIVVVLIVGMLQLTLSYIFMFILLFAIESGNIFLGTISVIGIIIITIILACVDVLMSSYDIRI